MGEMQPGSGGDHVGRKKKQQQQQQEGAAAGDSAIVVGCRKKNSGRMQGAGRGGQLQPAAAAGSRPKQQQQQQQLVVVGMDLTESCREMLTWVLTKQAQPGDHIVAVHVSAFSALVRHPAAAAAAAGESGKELLLPPRSATGTHQQQQQQELRKSLEGMLSVFQGLCNLKQVKLQLEIIRGSKVKKALVEFAAKQDASKLVLGSCNKHFINGRSASLGTYCLKRLPCTCTVVIVEHGLIVFDKQGSLKNEGPRSGTMLKVLSLNMRSFRRQKKLGARPGTNDLLISSSSSSHHDANFPKFKARGGFKEMSYRRLAPYSALRKDDDDGDDGDGDDDSSTSPTSVLIPSTPQQETVKSAAAGTHVEEFQIFFSRRQYVKQERGVTQSNKESISSTKKKTQLGFLLTTDQFHDNKPAVFSQLPLPHQQDLTSFSLFMKNHMMGADQDGSCSGFTSQAAAGMSAGDREKSLWLTPGWPLMHNAIGFDRKPVVEPVLSPTTTTTTTTPGVIERNLSVVNWALKLPGLRSRPNGPKKSLTKLPKGTTLVKGSHQYNQLVLGGELSSEAKFDTTSMRFSVNIDLAAAAASPSLQRNYHVSSTLAQQVECLCLDQPCTRFSYHQLKEATSNFSPSNIIGRGGASQVYKGKTPDGKLVAVKCLNQGGGHQAEEEFLTDIQITCNLSHVNIVTLLGYCADTPHMALVYDYVPQGSLDDHLHGDDKRVLAWRIRYRVALGVAEALDYLQNGCRLPVIHRDVKPSNVLLTENFEPRLSDFGLAKWGPTNAPHIPCNDVFGTFGVFWQVLGT
ncbi:hypothetical protein CY35_08G048200 [Sphagnum magellanicum]|nr:hypothetical protein CY35_08G048200 [Sphagnum magellanicum]